MVNLKFIWEHGKVGGSLNFGALCPGITWPCCISEGLLTWPCLEA